MLSNNILVDMTEDSKWHWDMLNPTIHEMLIQQRRRKLQPNSSFIIEGLDDDKLYLMKIHIEQADDCRYIWNEKKWRISSNAVQPCSQANLCPRRVEHRGMRRSGREWMSSPFDFDNLRISLKEKPTNPDEISLRSSHKYMLVVSVLEVLTDSQGIRTQLVKRAPFPNAQFVTTRNSHYRNETVRLLKPNTRLNLSSHAIREAWQNGNLDKLVSPNKSKENGEENAQPSMSTPQHKRSRKRAAPESIDNSRSPFKPLVNSQVSIPPSSQDPAGPLRSNPYLFNNYQPHQFPAQYSLLRPVVPSNTTSSQLLVETPSQAPAGSQNGPAAQSTGLLRIAPAGWNAHNASPTRLSLLIASLICAISGAPSSSSYNLPQDQSHSSSPITSHNDTYASIPLTPSPHSDDFSQASSSSDPPSAQLFEEQNSDEEEEEIDVVNF